ncbi:MAG: AMP-binding protein [Deltaproteobacteria bacterium]|nr:AMP-binding protein [Deltaproteobacteria bacterium]
MSAYPRTPLDHWLERKLGLPTNTAPDPEALADYQLERLRQTVAYLREHSPFYRRRLAGLAAEPLDSLADLARRPFTTAQDLREHHQAMLCLSQSRVARVVTLNTSGTTAAPKRLYFSDDDLELTLNFFHLGMSTMVEPGGRVLILLPGRTPDSVGDLLARALARMEVQGVIHGPVADPAETLAQALAVEADCLVGIPVQVLALAEHPAAQSLCGKIKSVLLTTDYVPRALARRVEAAWGCEVFEHYGMTETGLGAGVDCRAHQGYHLRAADLYYEVVNPMDGALLPPGEEGELVMTTLTRQAMPLLRYRTGDLGRLLPGPCPCGGFTPRLARVPGRLSNRLDLGGGVGLPMWRLDEALFALPGLLDFRAVLSGDRGKRRLELTVRPTPAMAHDLAARAAQAVKELPELAEHFATGELTLGPVRCIDLAWISDGTAKRSFSLPR